MVGPGIVGRWRWTPLARRAAAPHLDARSHSPHRPCILYPVPWSPVPHRPLSFASVRPARLVPSECPPRIGAAGTLAEAEVGAGEAALQALIHA